MDPISEQKRKRERTALFEDIAIESSSGLTRSRISDISIGGCFVETITPFVTGQEVSFHLADQSGRRLRFTGRVVYLLEGFGAGVEFDPLEKDHLDFLHAVLKKQT